MTDPLTPTDAPDATVPAPEEVTDGSTGAAEDDAPDEVEGWPEDEG